MDSVLNLKHNFPFLLQLINLTSFKEDGEFDFSTDYVNWLVCFINIFIQKLVESSRSF